jgi:hypothetical protein
MRHQPGQQGNNKEQQQFQPQHHKDRSWDSHNLGGVAFAGTQEKYGRVDESIPTRADRSWCWNTNIARVFLIALTSSAGVVPHTFPLLVLGAQENFE